MITLATLKNEFGLFMVNQAISSRLPDWIEWVLSDMLSSYEFWWNKEVGTFTTTSGTAIYFLNHRVSMKQVPALYDATNNRELREVSVESIYSADPTPTETGTPDKWAYLGQSHVQALNTAAGTVTVVSSSAADVSQKLMVRGLVSGAERYEELTLNGTSTVTSTLSFDINSVESVSLSAACAGVVTVARSVTIATIPPGYLRVECPKIRLQLVPGGTYTIVYPYYKKPVKPTQDNDIIDIPNEAFKALRYGIEEIGHMNNGDMDYSEASRKKYIEAKRELWIWSNRNLNKNETKDYRRTPPFDARIPQTITGNYP